MAYSILKRTEKINTMKDIKFRWVGLNKHFDEIQIQEGLTTEKMRNGETWTFFSESNKGDGGNCGFLGEDAFSGLISSDEKEAYLNDVILYQNTEGKTFKAILWFDDVENCLMVGGVPYHKLYNSGFIQPSKLEFEIIGSIYTMPEFENKRLFPQNHIG